MNRRNFLRSSTALLATTMLCPVSGLSRNSVLMGAQRAYMQVRANELYSNRTIRVMMSLDKITDRNWLIPAGEPLKAGRTIMMPMFGDPRLPAVPTVTIAGKPAQ